MSTWLAFLLSLCNGKVNCEQKTLGFVEEHRQETEPEILFLVLNCRKCKITKTVSMNGNVLESCNAFKKAHWECEDEGFE